MSTLINKAGEVHLVLAADLEVGGVLIEGARAHILLGLTAGSTGEKRAFADEGIWELAALSTDTWASGDTLYWDSTNKQLTDTATGNTAIGNAVGAKSSGATTAKINLNV